MEGVRPSLASTGLRYRREIRSNLCKIIIVTFFVIEEVFINIAAFLYGVEWCLKFFLK